MATLQEVLDQFVTWGTSWKTKAQAEQAAKEQALQGLTDAQTALSNFQAADAADDAVQLANQQAQDAQAAADAAQTVLDQVNAADAPPPPPEEPPVVTPPADGGDTGGDVGTVTPPADGGDTTTPPVDTPPTDTTTVPPADGGTTPPVVTPPADTSIGQPADPGTASGIPGAGSVVGDVSQTPVDPSGTGQ